MAYVTIFYDTAAVPPLTGLCCRVVSLCQKVLFDSLTRPPHPASLVQAVLHMMTSIGEAAVTLVTDTHGFLWIITLVIPSIPSSAVIRCHIVPKLFTSQTMTSASAVICVYLFPSGKHAAPTEHLN